MAKVLIIDDLPDYVNSLKYALKDEFKVETACNLEEAKEKTKDDIDIFLVDIRLDEKNTANYDGIVFLEWVKKIYPDKPVILMSGYSEYMTKKEEIINEGAVYFMKKPIFVSDLKEKLKELTK